MKISNWLRGQVVIHLEACARREGRLGFMHLAMIGREQEKERERESERE